MSGQTVFIQRGSRVSMALRGLGEMSDECPAAAVVSAAKIAAKNGRIIGNSGTELGPFQLSACSYE
jgi:hypothetical protein